MNPLFIAGEEAAARLTSASPVPDWNATLAGQPGEPSAQGEREAAHGAGHQILAAKGEGNRRHHGIAERIETAGEEELVALGEVDRERRALTLVDARADRRTVGVEDDRVMGIAELEAAA